MKDFLECRNAEVSIFGNVRIFRLGDYIKSKFHQNAGMKEEILNRKLLEFRIEYIF